MLPIKLAWYSGVEPTCTKQRELLLNKINGTTGQLHGHLISSLRYKQHKDIGGSTFLSICIAVLWQNLTSPIDVYTVCSVKLSMKLNLFSNT